MKTNNQRKIKKELASGLVVSIKELIIFLLIISFHTYFFFWSKISNDSIELLLLSIYGILLIHFGFTINKKPKDI